MELEKPRALDQAGWRVGEAADFLEMTPEKRQQLDAGVTNPGLGGSPGRRRRDEENALLLGYENGLGMCK